MRYLGASVLFFFIVANGCGPRADLHVRQRLLPDASTDCIGVALSRSPDVVQTPRLEDAHGSEIFWVMLRDSTATDGRRTVSVARPTRPDADGRVELTFVWTGVRRPAKAEEYAVISLANRVLARVRRACAPQTPAPVECLYGDGRVWRCAQTDSAETDSTQTDST